MNKKLFLKLGLLLLSLLFISCGQKNNSLGEDNFSKSITSQFDITIESSGKEIVETISPSVENLVEANQEDEEIEKSTQENTKLNIVPEATEKKYYDLIKESWQKQNDYIDSIDDSTVKQSLQTPKSAAIFKSNELLLEHPKDSKAIDLSLKRVLNGE